MVWEDGPILTLPPLTGDAGGDEATAIDDNGDIVGASFASDGCASAVLWPARNYNAPIDLNAAELSKDETLFVAQDISDTGDIVGQGGTCSDGSYVGNAHPWELIAPTPTTAKLTVTLAGSGAGMVTGTGTGAATQINCPGTCSQSYTLGANVTLTATPTGASTFSGFTGGGCSGPASSCVVTMTKAQDATATFAGGPAPKCTLAAGGRTVLLKRSKHSKRAPGTLILSAKCTEKLSARLTGTVTVAGATKPKHGKRKVKTYAVHAVTASLAAGKVSAMTVKLPAAALTALRHHRFTSATFTLVATNANGTGRAATRIGALKGRS